MREHNPLKKRWHRTHAGNYILRGNGFTISYNPSIQNSFKKSKHPYFKRLLCHENDREETALYIRKSDTWLILNGNFKREYEKCNSLTECIAIYSIYAPKYKSKWSTE